MTTTGTPFFYGNIFYCFQSLHCIKTLQFEFLSYTYKDCLKSCAVFLLYCWLKFDSCITVVSFHLLSAGLDMSLMLLWACMLSSHFSPQNFSTVTPRTVPGSKQCGATPGGGNDSNKGQLVDLHTNKTARCIRHFSHRGSVMQNFRFKGCFPDITVIQHGLFYCFCELNNCVFYKSKASKGRRGWLVWGKQQDDEISLHMNNTWLVWLSAVTISIRVGARGVETLNSTRLTEGVFSNVSVKRVCGQIIWPLQRKQNHYSLFCVCVFVVV